MGTQLSPVTLVVPWDHPSASQLTAERKCKGINDKKKIGPKWRVIILYFTPDIVHYHLKMTRYLFLISKLTEMTLILFKGILSIYLRI